MKIHKIPYQDLRFYSKIMKDYLDQKKSIENLYHRFPTLNNFEKQIKEKSTEWKNAGVKRDVLSEVLESQYDSLNNHRASLDNIEKLRDENTFTVTTGHQLNLFTGPLYFLYKIASTINLCKKLTAEYPENHFVPVYWMATEDHDFEEIQYFNYGERKIVYDRGSSGAVGRLNTEGLDDILDTFSNLLGNHQNAEDLKNLFKESYLKNKNLAAATRHLAHALFGKYGLVIIDADHPRLKSLASTHFKEDMLEHTAYQEVSQMIQEMEGDYGIQVNPREINLFYLTDDLRKRIIKKEGQYLVDETTLVFSKTQLLTELKEHPERFSPNVILRPLYQEVILPNLCCIGGGGEMAYWLELKSYFEKSKVTFPILLLRNSAQLMTSKQIDKAHRLDLNLKDLYQKDFKLEEQVTRQISSIAIDFEPQKQHLEQQFRDLYSIARETEKSFETAVAAQEQKQINGLEHLEKRLLKAQKRKLSDHTGRALQLQSDLMPNGGLQERTTNFSLYYQKYGKDLIDQIMQSLDPLDLRFTIIELE
ncbi:MAG: bacillithiol biosynthesis cysteine-adding enzyme BshC [Nonlabens sp.]